MNWKNLGIVATIAYCLSMSIYAQDKQDISRLREEIRLLHQQMQKKINQLQNRLHQLEKQQQKKHVQEQETEPEIVAKTLPTTATVNIQDLAQRVKKIEQGKKRTNLFQVYWNKGLRMKTEDEVFAANLGGRLFLDFGFIHEDRGIAENLGKMEDYAEFRTTRLYLSGAIYKNFIFKAQFEFSSTVNFKDVYLGLKSLPFDGSLIIGHFKEPFGLEEMTSSRFVTFMERASNSIFTPSRNIGIAYFGHGLDKRVTLAMGFFRETPNNFPRTDSDSGSYAFTARLTGLPIALRGLPITQDRGSQLLHLGVDYSFRNPVDNGLQFRSRPENHVGQRFVDTGNIKGIEAEHRLGLEGAFVLGPFSMQSELMYSWLQFKNAVVRGEYRF